MLNLLFQILTSITLLVNSLLLKSAPFELLYLELVNELCGNFIVYYLGIYSYVADVSAPEARATRLAVADGTDYSSTMIGTLIGAQIYGLLGFNAVFAISAFCGLCSLSYLIFFVKEPSHDKPKTEHDDRHDYGAIDGPADDQNAQEKPPSIWQSLNILESLKVAFKRRSGFKRAMIFMLIFNFACYILAYDGTEGTHRFYYVQKVYNWNEEKYSFFYSVYRVCYIIALLIILPILSKYFSWHDASIAMISGLCGALGNAIPLMIKPSWGMYLGSIIGSLNPACTITSRSMVSQCVENDEIGKILSIFTVMSALSSSVGTAAFQELYSATLTTFPGAFLALNALLYLIASPNNLILRRNLSMQRSIAPNPDTTT